MNGIEKITQRIAADAQQEADAILAQAQAEADAVTARIGTVLSAAESVVCSAADSGLLLFPQPETDAVSSSAAAMHIN